MSEDRGLVELQNGLSRRELLGRIAAAVVVAGNCTFSLEAAKHVHKLARQEMEGSGGYTPKLFKPHEYRVIERLTELIVPADDTSGSARDAGAPEFIDLLCGQNDELAEIYTGGLLWLDRESRRRYAASFLEAGEENQIELLRLLDEEARRLDAVKYSERAAIFSENTNYGGFRDYRSVPTGELAPGTRFFVWVRRMTVDAFYTSPIGIADLGYRGNEFLSEYVVPDEVLEFVRNLPPAK